MINYGTHATIKIGCKVVKEYFNITNIEHYNAILGTPFLRKMGIVILPQRAILHRTAELPWTGNEAMRVDHRWGHPKVPLTEAREASSA